MRRRTAAVLFALGAGLAAARGAAAPAAGASAAAELDLPASAAAAVLGAAAAGLGRDASALADNPALLGRAATAGVAASHAVRPLGVADTQLSGFASAAGLGTAGVQLRAIRATLTAELEDGVGGWGGPGGPFDYRTIVATVGAAPALDALTEGWPVRLRAGVAGTVVRRELAETGTTGLGGSAGLTAEWTGGWTGWLVARHAGLSRGTGWPAAVTAGAAWRREDLGFEGARLEVAGGGVWSREAALGGVLAVEYGVERGGLGAAARAGWSPGQVRSAGGLLPAAGISLRAASCTFDAGLVPMGALGWVQVFSVSFQERPGRH